jgi:redox-sensitive bicupin YhaK (pirin superfamily)
MPAGARFEQPLPASRNAFIYVYRGSVEVGGTEVPRGRMAILVNDSDSDGVSISATADSRLLLIAGEPLREPIVQYGPFVMNTTDQIRQTLLDFQAGRLGR